MHFVSRNGESRQYIEESLPINMSNFNTLSMIRWMGLDDMQEVPEFELIDFLGILSKKLKSFSEEIAASEDGQPSNDYIYTRCIQMAAAGGCALAEGATHVYFI